jgi:uncharacterized protein
MARTAGELGSWAVVGALAAAVVLQPLACRTPEGEGTGPAGDALIALLADAGPEVVVPTLDRALVASEALVESAEAWAAAEASGGDVAASREAAQEAWRGAVAVWQEAEVLQLGPGASSVTAAGGADLRDEVYSWPTVNPCRVDQETVYGGWSEAAFFEQSLVNVYGLDALETLLFAAPGVNACPGQVDINADGSWDAFGEAGVQLRRAEYAVIAATGVRDTIADLRGRWDDWALVLGAADAPYESPEDALNAVFDALFYLELYTKDRKLARPLGLKDCVGTACVGEVETPLAGGSNEWIAANLRGFRALYTGAGGAGMDDLLRSLGEDDLADAMAAALDEADAAAAALEVPIDEAALGDPAPAVALHDAVKGVTDLLKGDLATVLVLQVPAEAAGDND